MLFLSEEHAARFWAVWRELRGWSEQEAGSLLYVLTAFEDVWREALRMGVDCGDVLRVSVVVELLPGASRGRRVLLNWVLGLLGMAEDEMEPEALMILDREHFWVAVGALLIRRYGVSVLMMSEGGEDVLLGR